MDYFWRIKILFSLTLSLFSNSGFTEDFVCSIYNKLEVIA